MSASGRFGLHFLAKDQAALSKVFASKASDKFAQVEHRFGESGCPLIAGVLAAAECEVTQVCPGGDHAIVIGRVETIHLHGGEPLLFHRGVYAALDGGQPVS